MLIKQGLEKVLTNNHFHNFILYVIAEPINVGWGKKETQFHGSLGKAAAQTKQKEV